MIVLDEKTASFVEYLGAIGYKVSDEGKIIHSLNAEEEINSLYEGVGVRAASEKSIIELKGKDALDFLHRITTNELKDLPKQRSAQTIFTSEKGRILDTALIMNLGDSQLLICNRDNKDKVLGWIEKYVITDDVQTNDASDKYTLLELIGPQAESFIGMICGNVVNEIEVNNFKAISSEGFIFFILKLKDEYGHKKYWILGDGSNIYRLIKFMEEKNGPYNFNYVGKEAYNIYRVEQGIPAAPNELSTQFNPHEADLINMVSFTKGCYIGQEVIARLETYDKVQKRLTGVKFEENPDGNSTLSLFDSENKDAGVVTSNVFSFKLGKVIGLAYIRKEYLNNDSVLTAKDENGKKYTVIVESLPFIK
jgi:tRNA-modifying protein YgfZ